MKTLTTLLLIGTTALFFGCGQANVTEEHDDHDEHAGHDHAEHDHGEHGPHHGALIEVGAHLAHLEILHDDSAKTITIHALGGDAKTAITLEEAPKLNLMVGGEAVQVEMEGTGSEFTATHDAFAGEPEGKIAVKFEGKTYQLPLAHDHDHDH